MTQDSHLTSQEPTVALQTCYTCIVCLGTNSSTGTCYTCIVCLGTNSSTGTCYTFIVCLGTNSSTGTCYTCIVCLGTNSRTNVRNWRCPGLYKNQVSCRISLGLTVSSSTLIPSHDESKHRKKASSFIVEQSFSLIIKLF